MSKTLIGILFAGIAIVALTIPFALAQSPTENKGEEGWCFVAQYDSLKELEEHNPYPQVQVKMNGKRAQVYVRCS